MSEWCRESPPYGSTRNDRVIRLVHVPVGERDSMDGEVSDRILDLRTEKGGGVLWEGVPLSPPTLDLRRVHSTSTTLP